MEMASSQHKCAGCNVAVKSKDYMECSICASIYDLKCSNISSKQFSELGKEYRKKWKCPACKCCEPKGDNANTPVRSVLQSQQDASNVTLRNCGRTNKTQPKSTDEDTLGDITGSLRDIIREEIQTALKSALKQYVSEDLKKINDKISGFEKSLNFFNSLYEEMKTMINERGIIVDGLQKENKLLLSTVNSMTERLNLVEQHMRECNVEINGIPEHKTENLTNTVMQLASTVKCSILKEDVQLATRVAKMNKDSDRPRATIVKLKNRAARDNLIAAVLAYNKSHPEDKLCSHHLGVGGKREPVFVSEHLSSSNKSLHAGARLKAKGLGYKFVWIRDGRIYVRKNESSQAICVRNANSLELIV